MLDNRIGDIFEVGYILGVLLYTTKNQYDAKLATLAFIT
jgi:hypothetical protein